VNTDEGRVFALSVYVCVHITDLACMTLLLLWCHGVTQCSGTCPWRDITRGQPI